VCAFINTNPQLVPLYTTDADQNECGGGPARSCYPLPSECQIANLEIGTRFSIEGIKEHVHASK
jgi:hypothetical protein